MSRPLTERERGVLAALLGVDFEGVEEFRRQAAGVRVVGGCSCGCPSIDFELAQGLGMRVRANTGVEGTDDEVFLFTVGDRLGGIEYVDNSGESPPTEFPEPSRLHVWSA